MNTQLMNTQLMNTVVNRTDVIAGVLAYGEGYAYAGWGISVVVGVTYVAWLLRRGRKAAAQVPEGKRRWSDS